MQEIKLAVTIKTSHGKLIFYEVASSKTGAYPPFHTTLHARTRFALDRFF